MIDSVFVQNLDSKNVTSFQMSSVFDFTEITLAQSPTEFVLPSQSHSLRLLTLLSLLTESRSEHVCENAKVCSSVAVADEDGEVVKEKVENGEEE